MIDNLTAGALGFSFASVLLIPSIHAIVLQVGRPNPKLQFYRDQDGVSTEGLTSRCTAWAFKGPILLLSILGLAASTVLTVVEEQQQRSRRQDIEHWLEAGQWGLLLIQAITITLIRDSAERFRLGLYSALSSVLLLAVFFYHDLLNQSEIFYTTVPLKIISGLKVLQITLALLTIYFTMSIPRRPEVYFNDTPVDGQFTVSAIKRYTHGWVDDLLRTARRINRLEFDNLPTMDHFTRTHNLVHEWECSGSPETLGLKLIFNYRWPFSRQLLWTLAQSLSSFAPQYVNLKFLRILETRVAGEATDPRIWIWIIALVISLTGASWLEQWTYWISWSKLSVPIRAQLSALVYRKSMRRKDVNSALRKLSGNADSRVKNAAEEEPETQGTRSTTNLIGVDAKRVSDFCAINNILSGSIFKFIIATGFLSSILGHKAVLSGYAVLPIMLTVNFFVGKHFHVANHKLMKHRDAKLAVVTEALNGIRQIKFSAQESNWHYKIDKLRNNELGQQWKLYQYSTVMLFCYIFSPIAVAATSLSVFSYLYGGLNAAIAFTALAVFKNLEMALSIVPEGIARLLQARSSTKRIGKYLESSDVTRSSKNAADISFEDASVAWPVEEADGVEDGKYVLRNINLAFPHGELSLVGGKTGTGKSLLLAAILGEVDVLAGVIKVPHGPAFEQRRDDLATRDNWVISSSIAFVGQIPWVENASIRENIIFGLPFDEYRYRKVIKVCALRKDINMFPDGEWTEIGAKGINLSGGQKWRITFARALYSRAGTLVLDDIFSAVDSHVGRFIFENALTGDLGLGRTRILVTHHIKLCKRKAKYIVELGNGTVEHAGLKIGLEASGLLAEMIGNQREQSANLDEHSTSMNSESSDFEASELSIKFDAQIKAKKFVEEELRERGHVKFAYYLAYMRNSGGWLFWVPALGIFVAQEFLNIGQSWWLKYWTAQQPPPVSSSSLMQMPKYNLQFSMTSLSVPQPISSEHSLGFYLGIYIGISVVLALVGTLQYFYIYTGSIRASRNLFNMLSNTVLRAPLRWLDTVPVGRILTRFTSDFETVDNGLAWDASQFIMACCSLLGVVAAAVFISPWVIVLALVVVRISAYYSLLYLSGAREIKRLESQMKSPIVEQFETSLIGLSTIRAFAKVPAYVTRMENQIDKQTACSWYICATNRWIGIRTAIVGNIFTVVVAILVAVLPIPVELGAFTLNFASQYGSTVSMLVRQYTNMELDMNATERILEYANLPVETTDGADPPAAWPFEGRLEFNDLFVAYAPDLPPVLKGLSFSVEGRERIGVVGRTGAGKSSLTLAVFRFLEARQGSIHIDGIDISNIKLQALRKRLTIIPQDPTLFAGTIRHNLDPFDEHTDLELRDALEKVHLVTAAELMVTPPGGSATPLLDEDNLGTLQALGEISECSNRNIFASLSSPVTAGGLNLSQGQRQLLCLARAIISRPKIMLLDEATSAVDMATDTLIQRSIREDFVDSTLLVIAHRLSTIADFDKILVMDDGKAVEFGTPKDLIQLREGIFRAMVEESGDGKKILETIMSNRTIKRGLSIREMRNVYGV